MKILSTKTLFISLFLSVVPSTMQAAKKETGWADATFDFISFRVISLKSGAVSCFEKAGSYLEERAKNLSKNNPKTVGWLKDNPKKMFGLVVAATAVAVGVSCGKFACLYSLNKAWGNRKYVCCGAAATALYAALAYKGCVYSPSEMKNNFMSCFSKVSKK